MLLVGHLHREVLVVNQWPHPLGATCDVITGKRSEVRVAVERTVRKRIHAIIHNAVLTVTVTMRKCAGVAIHFRCSGSRRYITDMEHTTGQITVELIKLILEAALDAVIAEVAATAARTVLDADVECSAYDATLLAALSGTRAAGLVRERELVTDTQVFLRVLEEVPARLHVTHRI